MMPKEDESTGEGEQQPEKHGSPICGVMMPISETGNHSQSYWKDVQTLLHRAIEKAGFSPRNIWESSSTDRISERIIVNIFKYPMMIADISDLNPNVMLELGLRLSSRLPTIVVANEGATIPFDIKDFEAVFYPVDLNMLGMERFFSQVEKRILMRHSAKESGNYTPFLADVIVNVASPETREVGMNELLLSRLDEITARIASVEASVHVQKENPAGVNLRPGKQQEYTNGVISITIPDEMTMEISKALSSIMEVETVETGRRQDGTQIVKVHYYNAANPPALQSRISDIATRFSGTAVLELQS